MPRRRPAVPGDGRAIATHQGYRASAAACRPTCICQWRYVVTSAVVPAPRRYSGAFWMLALLLVMTLLLGGGSRADIASLMVLRPAAAVLLCYGIWGLTREQMADHRFLFCIASAVVGLVLAQLIPLPPAAWSLLPGRELVTDIDRAAGLGAVWRPLSLVPSATWNALFSLIPPLAAIVLAVRLTSDESWGLLPVIIGIGVISAILALLQLGGDADGPLYLYKETNRGSAVGLFANRNHHAVFLAALLPVLAAYGSFGAPSSLDYRLRTTLALAIGVFFIVLILVIGSRAGLLLMLLALPGMPLLYRFPESQRPTRRRIARPLLWAVLVVLALIALGMLTSALGRALAIERLLQPVDTEVRYKAWGQVLAMTWHYFPAGTGFGSFADVFKVDEPHRLLSIFTFNHAHNDWLELILTGGVAACLLLVIVAVALVMRMRTLSSGPRDTHHLMASLGMWIIALFALASLGDYPLRVPSIACLFSVALVWISSKARLHAGKKAFDAHEYLFKQGLKARGSGANA